MRGVNLWDRVLRGAQNCAEKKLSHDATQIISPQCRKYWRREANLLPPQRRLSTPANTFRIYSRVIISMELPQTAVIIIFSHDNANYPRPPSPYYNFCHLAGFFSDITNEKCLFQWAVVAVIPTITTKLWCYIVWYSNGPLQIFLAFL